MNDVDIFDECIRSEDWGERLDFTRLPPERLVLHIEYLRRAQAAGASAAAYHPKMPVVYMNFVRNSTFNAYAFRCDGRYFIAFFDGLPAILRIVIGRMLADRELFRHIGDPSVESPDLPILKDFFPDAILLSDAFPDGFTPNDSARQLYVIHLCRIAFDVLSAHEIAHIANGHVDYMNGEYGIPYVSELGWQPGTAHGNLESQAMEFDADCTAARNLVNTVKAQLASATQLPPEMAAFFREPADAMFDVAAAVSIVFRLFGDSRMNGVDLSGYDHPPIRWRQMQVLNTMGNCVDQSWDSSLLRPVELAFTKAIEDVEAAFERITASPQQVEGLGDAWHGEGWPYAESVTECWNNTLRPKLAKYAAVAPNSYHFNLPIP